MEIQLEQAFRALTGHFPLRWQSRLFTEYLGRGELPLAVDVPTGLGKTAVMALWLIARAAGAALPRRLVYVVDRRTVVDQATEFAVDLRRKLDEPEASGLKSALGLSGRSLPISTLRGQHADNREWLIDPGAPAIVVGTVDMVGSRLLFEGYGVSRGMRPYQAGLLGADALVLIDESHLVPPFEALLASIASGGVDFGAHDAAGCDLVPAFRVLPLSATSRTGGANVFRLDDRDFSNADGSVSCEISHKRLTARKWASIEEVNSGELVERLAERAWHLAFAANRAGGRGSARATRRVVVFCDRRDEAEKVKAALDKRAAPAKKGQAPEADTELLVGARRVRERQLAAERLKSLGFLAGSQVSPVRPAFLVATSAGEVGVDLDADDMVCDLVTWERMVQRLGRVNRRGDGEAEVVVVREAPSTPSRSVAEAREKPEADRTKKDRKAIAQYESSVATHEALPLPLAHLPQSGGKRDASPLALMNLARRAASEDAVRDALHRATLPVPLRPALTRALVDAWAMTSLPEHTGRPEVQPWLRGWVDEEPQTQVVWRRHLPIRTGGQDASTAREIEDYFEAASPHVSEILETESFRVLEWLKRRADRLLGKDQPTANALSAGDGAAAADSEGTALEEQVDGPEAPGSDRRLPAGQTPPADAVIGVLLTGSGKYERSLRLADLVAADKKVEAAIEATLSGRTLILDSRFAGLSADGLLDAKAAHPPEAADEPSGVWIDSVTPVVPYRVRSIAPADEEGRVDGGGWHEAHVFVIERSAEGEPLRVLSVEAWRDAANNEDARATGPAQTLEEHQSWAERCASALAVRLGLPQEWCAVLALAARVHDEGKRTVRWQEAFNAPNTGGTYAKTRGPIRQKRLEGYRHEFGSLPLGESNAALNQLPEAMRDLVLHLIAAHHGYGRPLIPVAGCDDAPPSALQERAREVALRFARLQQRWGPWGLAWWEALLRAADQQASRENEERGREPRGGS